MRRRDYSGQLARKHREAKGLSRADAVPHLGIQASTLGYYEGIGGEPTPRVPDANTLMRMSELYGVPLDDFFSEIDP